MPDQRKFDSFLDGIAKDVSAFLNSDSGLPILGVSEMKSKVTGHPEKMTNVRILANRITWGTLTHERLEGNPEGRVRWNSELFAAITGFIGTMIGILVGAKSPTQKHNVTAVVTSISGRAQCEDTFSPRKKSDA